MNLVERIKFVPTIKLMQTAIAILFSVVTSAQEYTLTTSAANIISNRALIDLSGLSGNSNAIIVATPLGNTKALNPHPVGVWYYSNKWNIFNSDYAVMIPGLTYKIQYFLNPGSNEFLHLVTQQNLGADGSYIDHPALNNQPNAQFIYLQNHSPDVRQGSSLNKFETRTGYSPAAKKWFIANTGGQPLLKGAVFNIVITNAQIVNSAGAFPIDNPTPLSCKCPASLPPNGMADGDLTGMYPDPMVRKILGRPLSHTAPVPGQILKWNGTEWTPSNDALGNGTAFVAAGGLQLNGTTLSAVFDYPMWNANKLLGRDIVTDPPAVGQVLKWGGGSWYPANDNTGSGTAATYTATNGIQLTGTEFSALNNNSIWNANRLNGRDIATTQPAAGQTLKWNGTAWAPADDNTGSTTTTPSIPVKSYYKYTQNTQGSMEVPGRDNEIKIPSISGIVITVTVPSRLVISGSCYVRGDCPPLGSCGLSMEFYYKVNNVACSPFGFAGAEYFTATIANHFFDVAPGTYTLDFYSRKRSFSTQLNYSAAGSYATVMVLPN